MGSRWIFRLSHDLGDDDNVFTEPLRAVNKPLDIAGSCVHCRGVSEARTTSTASAEDATAKELAELLKSSPALLAALQAERAAFAAERATFAQRIVELETERDNLRASHERLRQELELFKRRLFIAKAERADTKQQADHHRGQISGR